MSKALNYFFYDNPYCVLGISCTANEMEVIRAKEKISKLARLGAEHTYKTFFHNSQLPMIDRSEGIVQSVLSTIHQPHHRLFWFESSEIVASHSFNSNFEKLMNYSNENINYDEFLGYYIQLLLHDSSIQFELAWNQICFLIDNFGKNKEYLQTILKSRNLEKPVEEFSKSILKPISLLIDELNLDSTVKLLNVTKKYSGEEFNSFHRGTEDQIIKKVEENISFFDDLHAQSKEEKDRILIIANTMRSLCDNQIGELLELIHWSPVLQGRIKQIIYTQFEKIIDYYGRKRDYASALLYIQYVKKFAPSHKENEVSILEDIFKTYKRSDEFVKQKVAIDTLSIYDEILYFHKDYRIHQLFLKAIDGDEDASKTLGKIYLTRLNERTKQIEIGYCAERGIYWLRQSASNGNLESLLLLGFLYLQGEKVPKNVSTSKEFLQMAADRGSAEAIQFIEQSSYLFEENQGSGKRGDEVMMGRLIKFLFGLIVLFVLMLIF